jgi:hypothetical protein
LSLILELNIKTNYVAFAKLPENVKREIYNAYRDDTFFEMKNEYLTEIIKAFAFENIFVYNFEKFCAFADKYCASKEYFFNVESHKIDVWNENDFLNDIFDIKSKTYSDGVLTIEWDE